MTDNAQDNVYELEPEILNRVIAALRDAFPEAEERDRVVDPIDSRAQASIHYLGLSDPAALNDDGEDEAVILTILGRDEVSKAARLRSLR